VVGLRESNRNGLEAMIKTTEITSCVPPEVATADAIEIHVMSGMAAEAGAAMSEALLGG